MSSAKRTALAACSMFLSIAQLAIISFVPNAIRFGVRSQRPLLQMLPVYFVVAAPGLVLALPFVLYFKDANGRRAWKMLAIGTGLGPAFIIISTLLLAHGHFTWQGDGFGVFLSFWIAFLTTGLYVLLLRRFTPTTPQ